MAATVIKMNSSTREPRLWWNISPLKNINSKGTFTQGSAANCCEAWKQNLETLEKYSLKGKQVVMYGGEIHLKTQSIGKTRKRPLHSYLWGEIKRFTVGIWSWRIVRTLNQLNGTIFIWYKNEGVWNVFKIDAAVGMCVAYGCKIINYYIRRKPKSTLLIYGQGVGSLLIPIPFRICELFITLLSVLYCIYCTVISHLFFTR